MVDMLALVKALLESGDIPNRRIAADVFALASITEDSVEAVASAMDMLELDGSAAFSVAEDME